jgi:hypothetical protein
MYEIMYLLLQLNRQFSPKFSVFLHTFLGPVFSACKCIMKLIALHTLIWARNKIVMHSVKFWACKVFKIKIIDSTENCFYVSTIYFETKFYLN